MDASIAQDLVETLKALTGNGNNGSSSSGSGGSGNGGSGSGSGSGPPEQEGGITVIMALQQPRPEIFALMDHVILMKHGEETSQAPSPLPPNTLPRYL